MPVSVATHTQKIKRTWKWEKDYYGNAPGTYTHTQTQQGSGTPVAVMHCVNHSQFKVSDITVVVVADVLNQADLETVLTSLHATCIHKSSIPLVSLSPLDHFDLLIAPCYNLRHSLFLCRSIFHILQASVWLFLACVTVKTVLWLVLIWSYTCDCMTVCVPVPKRNICIRTLPSSAAGNIFIATQCNSKYRQWSKSSFHEKENTVTSL